MVYSSFSKDARCDEDLEKNMNQNISKISTEVILIPSDLGEKVPEENQNDVSVTRILGLSDGVEKSNDFKGYKVESLSSFSDVKSIDSIESVKSLDSIKSDEKSTDNKDSLNIYSEKWYSITIQVTIPFLIAGMGTIGAGLILGSVEEYDVFKDVEALFILVPAILGLKGNLDMCLASRLSTQANLGNMVSKKEIMKMIIGNIGLVQVQSIVAAAAVSVYAILISALVMDHSVDLNHSLLILCCSILTATLSCFALDFVLTGVIFTTHKFKMNPDNLATPLAASIGDVVSLTVFSLFARNLYKIHDSYQWILFVIVGVYAFVVLPTWIIIVRKNKYTKDVLMHGWVPVFSALCISGVSGLVLETAINKFKGFVVFQPIINGVGGNLVSVQASRISTMLHKSSLPGILPPHTKQWVWPWTALCSGVLPAKTARILILMSIPGQILFVIIADIIYNKGSSTVTITFVLSYLTVGVVQIVLLLYIAHLMIHYMWRLKMDPDNSAIPYLTSLGDLFGSSFLLLAFMFLQVIKCEYAS